MNIKNEMNKQACINTVSCAVKEILACIPEINAIANISKKIYLEQKNRKLRDFFCAYALKREMKHLTEDDIREFSQKCSNPETESVINDILDSVIFSGSHKSRFVLGIIAGNLLRNNGLNYEDMILIRALKDLLDEELERFLFFCTVRPNDGMNGVSLLEDCHRKDFLIMEKLQNLGIFSRDLSIRFDIKNTELRFLQTDISRRLHEYLEDPIVNSAEAVECSPKD